MNLILAKTYNGFAPADQATADYHAKCKIGTVLHGGFKKLRNPAFHRKFFALLNVAYDLWEPGEISSEYGKPEKNFDRFREDLTILAGYYFTTIRVDGSVRVEAKSIAFSNMENNEFEKLYSAVIGVILQKILTNYTRDDIDEMVERVLRFS